MVQRIAAVLLMALAGGVQADTLKMGALFVDHAVLQRDRPLDIFGTAAPQEEITVTLAGVSANGRADAQGRWNVQLPAQAAGGPHVLTARGASGTQTANDVLV